MSVAQSHMKQQQQQLARGRNFNLPLDDQFDVSSSNPEMNGFIAKVNNQIEGPDGETTTGINSTLPSKDQKTARSCALEVNESKKNTIPKAFDGLQTDRGDGRYGNDLMKLQLGSGLNHSEGTRVSNRYPVQQAAPNQQNKQLPQYYQQQMQFFPPTEANSDFNADQQEVTLQQEKMRQSKQANVPTFHPQNNKDIPALNQNFFSPSQNLQSLTDRAGDRGDFIKWSDSIAKINQKTEKNLECLQGLTNSDLPAARERSMTEREQMIMSSDRGHEEREMDLLDRQKGVESLTKYIKQNQPGVHEQDAKRAQHVPRSSRKVQPQTAFQSSQMGPMTPTTKRASILSSLDFYGRYNPISQQGIDLNMNQRRNSPDAFHALGFVEQNENLNDRSNAFGQQPLSGGLHHPDHQRELFSNKLRSRSAGHHFQTQGMPPHSPRHLYNNYVPNQQPSSIHPQVLRDLRSAASLEMRAFIEQAKQNIKQFYDMYDQKMKSQLTHPLFQGIESNPDANKTYVLTEQVELLENEMARRIRDLVWAQSLLKKDQIATKKRIATMVTDKNLDIQLNSFRGHVQDQLSQFSRDMLEMKALINTQKFELETKLINQAKAIGSGNNLQNSGMGNNSKNGIPRQDASMLHSGMSQGALLSQQDFVKQKSEIYDYMNHQFTEMDKNYSAKFDLLSNYILQVQDKIKGAHGMKISADHGGQDISQQIQNRDKVVQDSINQNSEQLIQLSNSLKDQSGFIMRLKSQLAEMKSLQEQTENRRIEDMTRLQSHLENTEQDLVKKIDASITTAAAQQAQVQQNQSNSQQPIAEVVKQISKLASSLQSFEQDNISKIQRTHKEMQNLSLELQKIKNDVKLGADRQEEAEQSFLKSFQDIKTIVLTKLQVFDKQIESKEEWEKMREAIRNEQVVQKALQDEITAIKMQVDTQVEGTSLIDKNFIEVHDKISESQKELRSEMQKLLQEKHSILNISHEQRLSLVETQLNDLYTKKVVVVAADEGVQNAKDQQQQQQQQVANLNSINQLYASQKSVKSEHDNAKPQMSSLTNPNNQNDQHQQNQQEVSKESKEAEEQQQNQTVQQREDNGRNMGETGVKRGDVISQGTFEELGFHAENEVPKKQQLDAAQRISNLLTKQQQKQTTNQGLQQSKQVGGGGATRTHHQVFDYMLKDESSSQQLSHRQLDQSNNQQTSPGSVKDIKDITATTEQQVHKSNDQSTHSKDQVALDYAADIQPLNNAGRDLRESIRTGSDEEEDDITNPFISDQDGNKGGIVTVTSNINIGMTGQGFQSSDFKLGSQNNENLKQGISQNKFYATVKEIQPVMESPIEHVDSPAEPQPRPKTKTGRAAPMEQNNRLSSPVINEKKLDNSPPIIIQNNQVAGLEISGVTQNILIMDDKRDDSKPSGQSVPSGQSMISAPSAPDTSPQQDLQCPSSLSSQRKEQQPFFQANASNQQLQVQKQDNIPSTPQRDSKLQNNSVSADMQPRLQMSSESKKIEPVVRVSALGANSSLDMIHLNSSGETVPMSPVQMGTPSHPQRESLDESRGGVVNTGEKKPSLEALDNLTLKNSQIGLHKPIGQQQPANVQQKPNPPSVQKATQELKDKVASHQLKKDYAQSADQITFEILADTVAKEIAVMLRSTIDRNKKPKK